MKITHDAYIQMSRWSALKISFAQVIKTCALKNKKEKTHFNYKFNNVAKDEFVNRRKISARHKFHRDIDEYWTAAGADDDDDAAAFV